MSNSIPKMLLIEDNPGDVELIREMMSGVETEYTLATADSLSSGLKLLENEKIDVVLLDLGLPDSSGPDTFRKIQEQAPELPVIVLTILADENLAIQAIALGVQDYLVKGRIDGDLLVRSIRYAIERKRAEERTRQSKELSDAVNRINVLIFSTLDFDEIMRRVIEEAAKATGADSAAVYMPENNTWVARYVYNLPQVEGKHFTEEEIKYSTLAVKERRTVLISNLSGNDEMCRVLATEYGVKALLDAPLLLGADVVGDFSLYSCTEGKVFSEQHEDFINKVAASVTLAVSNARLFKETERGASQLRAVVENMGDGLLVADARGNIITANPAMLAMAGLKNIPKEDLTQYARRMNIYDRNGRLLPLEEWPLSRALRGETVRNEELLVHALYSGKFNTVLFSAAPSYDSSGRVALAIATVRDIAERKRIEQELGESERKFRQLYDTIREGIVITDLEGRVLECNWAYLNMLGYTGEEIRRVSDEQLTPSERHETNRAMSRQALEQGHTGEFESEYKRKDGTTFLIAKALWLMRNERDQPTGFWGIVRDITERKKVEDEMRHMAQHDALTGLPNRRLFNAIITVELAQARRHGNKLAILLLDLDRFKEINDTFGHEAGDKLLKEMASRLKSAIRSSDTVARMGGDEFNVIVSDIGRAEFAAEVAQKLLTEIRTPFMINGHEINVSISIGISVFPDDSQELETLFRYADIAMYHAKEKGRNNYQFYNPAMNTRSIERIRLENSLRQAIERNEFRLYYQPLIDIKSNRIVSAEALLRWQHPDRGLLEPAKFFSVAEDIGFMPNIDEWVLTAVGTQIRKWREEGASPVCVNVNISAREFENQDLSMRIRNILDETGAAHGCLDIEITETTAMGDVESTITRLHELAELGVKVSIDDFGTGFSSLNHLKRLPIRKLKLDRSFIRDIVTDAGDRTIITAVLLMAHAMKLKVVAEGVEGENQLAFLRALHCDEAQGFLFGGPVPAEEFAEMMK